MSKPRPIALEIAEIKAEGARELLDALIKVPPTESTHLTFSLVLGVPVKIAVKTSCQLLGGAGVGVSIEAATAADLEEAMRVTEDHEMRVRLRTLLNLLREGAAEREPIDVRIINAGELKSDKAIRITRDEGTGKMTGAVVANMS